MTGEIFPLVYLGRLVPGTGDFINGMEVFDGTPQTSNPFKLAPRIGFAWDVTGDGRTSVRAGAGVFYDRYSDDNVLETTLKSPMGELVASRKSSDMELAHCAKVTGDHAVSVTPANGDYFTLAGMECPRAVARKFGAK